MKEAVFHKISWWVVKDSLEIDIEAEQIQHIVTKVHLIPYAYIERAGPVFIGLLLVWHQLSPSSITPLLNQEDNGDTTQLN